MVDYKKLAAEDLKKYNFMRQSLANIPQQIDALKEASLSVKAGMSDSEPISGGGSHAEDRLLTNICKRQMLQHNYKYMALLVEAMDEALNNLDDRERAVLDGLYINPVGVEYLADKIGYEKSHIYRIKDEALKKYTVAMYGIVEY